MLITNLPSPLKECLVEETVKIRRIDSLGKGYRSLYKKPIRECKINHLSRTSTTKIKVECPRCNKIRKVRFRDCFREKFSGLCGTCSRSYLGKSNAKNLTKMKFGKLTVLDSTEKRIDKKVIWKCLCDCGNFKEVISSNLLSGHTMSCGCLKKEKLEEYHRSKDHRISTDYTQEENEAYQEETNTFYNSKEWYNKRWEIIKRDKQCKLCGTTNKLVVHHIYGRKLYPEYAFDNEKLITLCKSCHQKYHNSNKEIVESSFLSWIRR